MIKRFFNSQTKTVTFAAGLLSISALLSKALGLIRDGLLAGHFGASIETDIYFAAFRIPDFVYNFLIVGGLTIAFLPLFSDYYLKDKEKSWEMVSNLLNVFLFFLVIISFVLFLFTPYLMRIVAPGFSEESLKLAALLTRLMFLSPILFGISNIFSGILHYFNRFLSYSLAPVLYNLGIIFGILFFVPYFGIIGLGLGVILGAFLHLIIQLPAAFLCGFKYRISFNLKHPALLQIFKLMIPRSFAIGAQQINLVIITAIASTLSAGSIAIFNFSNNLYHLPIGIFGISFAVACFPELSRTWALGKSEEFFKKLSSSFRQVLFLVIPASVLIFLLRAQLVRVVLGSLGPGRFNWQDTRLTAASLGIFSFSILASALIPLICRVFFSLKDTKTPTLVTGVGVLVNVFLSLFFTKALIHSGIIYKVLSSFFDLSNIENIAVVGLPLAFSLAAILQLFFLLLFLYFKVGNFRVFEIFNSFLKITIASLFLGLATYFGLYLLSDFVNMKTFSGVLLQGFLAGSLGILVYLLLSLVFRISELRIIRNAVVGQFKKDECI